jgi:hypothetical protein
MLTSGGVTLSALRTGQREAASELLLLLLLLLVLLVGWVGLDCSVGLSAASFALTRSAHMHAMMGSHAAWRGLDHDDHRLVTV